MTTSNLKPTQVLIATLITFLSLLLLNKVNSSDDISFNFDTKFVPNQKNLLFQGDASVSTTGVLQLTKVENGQPNYLSIGRALYIAPVHIWDSTTSRLASFTTSFSFVLKARSGVTNSAGLTFFLAPPDSVIPPNSDGGFFGLFSNENYNSSNQIVAVEFDTYYSKTYNPWDPNYIHIGIDVNSVKSTKTVAWDFKDGEIANVIIHYLAPTKTLIVTLNYPSDQSSYIVSASVDLKAILPEWVRVGFSAATSRNMAETHDVLNWYFTSTLKDKNYNVEENNMHIARCPA